MSRRSRKCRVGERSVPGLRIKERLYRLSFEPLEDRTMLDSGLPVAIVVGRTLSVPQPSSSTTPPLPSYFVGEVQNQQVTIRYTVYNEQADPETGVLLTTTLEPGVTIDPASVASGVTTPLPDRSGQNLAWSLGTIQGYERASVTLVVDLASSSVLQLDSGAHVFATLDAGGVSNVTPAATLRTGNVSSPGLLVGMPDPNDPLASSLDQNDPYIQEEAAKLSYDPTQIFTFLHTQIGYNAYAGSLRGARGTLWSMAGNALDVANLGVALMRASGIPAQYVSGTLLQSQAQTLILSMFPAHDQTVGYIPSGTETADPADDPTLLQETESHDWFEFDTGHGMQDADPLMAGATIGQSFTTPTGTFAEVPDSLRQTVEVSLNAEISSSAATLFGLGPETTTVLDQTFTSADLYGRSLSVGNLVQGSAISAIISNTTFTYTPYIIVNNNDGNIANAPIILGTSYQEDLTNFPLGSQVLTGLFLDLKSTSPTANGGTESQTFERTIVDRIGYAARQSGASVSLTSSSSGMQPAVSPFDIVTIDVTPGDQIPGPLLAEQADLASLGTALDAASTEAGSTDPSVSQAGTTQGDSITRNIIMEATSLLAGLFIVNSDQAARTLSNGLLVQSYVDAPRFILASSSVSTDSTSDQAQVQLAFDILNNPHASLPYPGQAASLALGYRAVVGLTDSFIENQLFQQLGTSTGFQTTSSYQTIMTAVGQGIPLIFIGQSNLSVLDQLDFSADAKARITSAVQSGKIVLVPDAPVSIDGTPTTAWFEIDPTSGYTVAVSENGLHGVLAGVAGQFASIARLIASLTAAGELVVYGIVRTAATSLARTAFARAALAGIPLSQVAQSLYNLFMNELEETLGMESVFYTEALAAARDGIAAALKAAKAVLAVEPPAGGFLSAASALPTSPTSRASILVSTAADPNLKSLLAPVRGQLRLTQASVSHVSSASWQSTSKSSFLIQSLSAASAVVVDANGKTIGSGVVALSAQAPVAATIAGNVSYSVNGSGSLSFYGPAESSLGVSGNWDQYKATVAGGVAITLDGSGLTLNGTALAAGSYTITTASATIAGSGPSTSPNFAGSATIATTSGTVELGTGTGSLAIGSTPLDTSGNGLTLTGYAGTVTVSPNADGTDTVGLNGPATNLIQLASSPASVSADQNTPAAFQADIQTSLADSDTLTAQAPAGWTVSIDNSGKVTVTPAPGLQGGTYPIQIFAQSTTNPDLAASSLVNVTVTPTQPGITLAVAPDPVFTVPYNGVPLPTAFRASIRNLGPASDTYALTFSNVPGGFTLLDSGTSLTVPAGQTGIVGLYLMPSPGHPLPAPGTKLSFTVTATSASNSKITQSQVETFTVPAIDAVTVTSQPASLSTTPGTPVQVAITLTNVGNVAENNMTLKPTLSAGLTASGLLPLSLAVGQSMTETVTLAPSASIPLNSTLQATLTATYGASASPATQSVNVLVQVAAPGVAVINDAAVAAAQLTSNTGLAPILTDLGTDLTNLYQNPTSPVYASEAQADLTSLISQVSNDPFLVSFAAGFSAAQTALGSATSAAGVQAALTSLGTAMKSLAQAISDEAASGFTLSLSPDRQIVQPNAPEVFDLVMTNNGNTATTYDLAVKGLPSGVTSSFSQSSVTLQPGQSITPGNNAVSLTLTESGTSLTAADFTVTATAEGAPETTLSTPGELTLRSSAILIGTVSTNPPFTNAGGQVTVSAQVEAVVNAPTQVTASYTVTNPSGTVLYTSPPTSVSLSPATALTTPSLGTLDTTGFADGTDTITVTLDDATGKPIPDATGVGSLVIGSPVTATLNTTPAVVPTGAATVTSTVQVSTGTSYPSPLTLQGAVTTPAPGTSVALYQSGGKTYAYESGTGGIDDIDVTDPTNPQLLEVFGQNSTNNGSFGYNIARVVDGYLFLATTVTENAGHFNLLVFSLTDPANPTLVSNTSINDQFLSDLIVNSTGTVAFVPLDGVYDSGGNPATIYSHFGNFASIDLTDPTMPTLGSVLFNNTNYSNDTGLAQFGGALVNDQTAYVTGLSPGGNDVANNTGNVLVVNVSDPTNMTITTSLLIPNTNAVTGAATYGNEMLVIGSAGPQASSFDTSATGVFDNLSLTLLNITDPNNPTIMGQTFVTPEQFPVNEEGQRTDVVSLGNGDFAVSDTDANGKPALLVIDPSNPSNMIVSAAQVPSGVHGITVSGSELYASTSSGLSIYNIGQLVSDPVTVTVNLPAGTAANIVPGSYTIPPTQVNTSASGDSLVWDRSFASGNTTFTFSWQTSLLGVQAGQSIPVTTGASVAFQALGTPGTTTAPGTSVTGESIVSISPATQTVQPGGMVTYDVRLTNPTDAPVTYYEVVEDFTGDASYNLPYSVTVPAQGSVDEPLTFTSNDSAQTGSFPITVAVSDSQNMAYGTASSTLVIAGAPLLQPDSTARGVVVSLTPTQATAGQGTSAKYVVQVTNTGSATDDFYLQVTGLANGVNATLGEYYVDVPPGAGNFRDVTLILTPGQGTTPGPYNFTVKAVSSARSSVTGSAGGTLTVTATGVSVTLNPPSASPGAMFQATVTNTGTVTDTFNLALGGPGGLVSTLAQTKVTLAPNQSKVVPITTGSVNFAESGSLNLTAIATSQSQPSVQAAATTTLTIPTTNGFTSQLSPATRSLPRPGATTALLAVNNTGNTEDEYQAVIAGTKGPVTASLVGLDGKPTQAITLFRLPGLSTGEIQLDTNLTSAGIGVVIIQVKSLSTGKAINMIATVTTTKTVATTTALSLSAFPPGSNGPLTLTSVVTAATSGSVTFTIDGKAQPAVALKLVNGHEVATLTIPSLTPGTHTFQAFYGGSGAFTASHSAVKSLVVPKTSDGPRITNVWRMGYHTEPTTLILGFNEALNPTRADNPNAYTILGPNGQRIKVLSAVYDAGSQTVTLHPSAQLNLHLTYKLIVSGTGSTALLSAQGLALDGAGNGRPGSNSTTRVTMANWTLVLPPPLLAEQAQARPATPKPSQDLSIASHPTGPLVLAKPATILAKSVALPARVKIAVK